MTEYAVKQKETSSASGFNRDDSPIDIPDDAIGLEVEYEKHCEPGSEEPVVTARVRYLEPVEQDND